MPYTPRIMPIKMKPVCLNCENRHPACHDKCEKYINEKNRVFQENIKQVKYYKAERDIEDYEIKEKMKNKRG